MESSKLKNIVLIILVITNLLLGFLMVFQGVADHQRQTQTLQDAVSLLKDRGIELETDALPRGDFPTPMILERSSDWERQMFSALLGSGLTVTQRGLVSYYESGLGRAEVREDGSFSVTFVPGALPLDGQDLTAHALAALKRMGFDAQATAVEDNALEAVQLLDGSPIFSCTASLRYENDALAEITGTRLVGVPVADNSQGVPLSTATLLLRFRAGIIDSGDACSAIHSATQGYLLTTSATGGGGKPRLTPVLQLEADTGLYLVDALTGTLSRE